MMQKLVVLSGAGISAESGIKTFRDSGGLWEQYPVEQVASIDGWYQNPSLVLDFYNKRRKEAAKSIPNYGHIGLVELEKWYDVRIITQNVDCLHEKAGSKHVIHLHGELSKVRSTGDPSLIYDIGDKAIFMGDKCDKGYQLRPHIVWFGEAVPEMERAIDETQQADIFVVIGTSLNVYPAAGLIQYTKPNIPIYIIDPHVINVSNSFHAKQYQMVASEGVKALINDIKP